VSEITAIVHWVYSTLAGDETLTDLLATETSIYDTRAPQGASTPYITIEAQVTEDVNGVGGVRIMSRAEVMVRAVTQSASFASANAIADQADTLLHGAVISTNADGTVLSCTRDRVVRGIDDIPGGGEARWAGGVYDIQSQA